MKKLLKWLVRIVISLLVLVVIAAVVLPLVIDPNDYKDTIEEKIQANIGRAAHLNGDIEWKVFPWLALTFNDVTLENEKGFKGDSLAVIQVFSARVKIIPLLTKNIEIGKVAINDAQFNLQVNKKGHSNWQGILNYLDNDKNSSSDKDSKSSNQLDIAGIELNNISLNYTDLQSKTQANITKFNLTTGQITKNEPVEVDAAFHLKGVETGLDVDINTETVVKNLLNGSGIIADINSFDITGKLSGQSSMSINITLDEAGQIDLGKDSMNFPAVSFALGEVVVSTNMAGKNISQKNISLSGSYQLAQMNLNEFLKKLTGAYFVTTNTFDDFSSSGSWSIQGQRFKLPDLKISYDDTVIAGSADIKNMDKLVGSFQLKINKFNVDDFLGDEQTAAASEKTESSTTTPDINFGHLKGSVTIDELRASGTTIENLKINIKTNGSKMDLSPISGDFYQGLLVTTIKIDTKAVKNKVIVEHNMSKIQSGPLLTDLAGSELLTGLGNFDANLKIDKPFSDIPLKSSHGNISFTLSDGAIYGVDVFGMMQKGLSMLYPELKEEADDGEKKTTFALMQMDADINEGILKTNTLKIESPYLKIKGKLTIDLVKMTIKGTIEPELLDIPEQLVSEKYKKLIGLPIPVTLSGSLLEPKVSIDAKRLILNTQKKKIDKEKDKLKKKLLDGLFGGD